MERGSRSSPGSKGYQALGERDVSVWLLPSDSPQAALLLSACPALLPAEELAQQERLRRAAQRREFLLGRALARCALSRHAPVRPEDWRFERDRQGRPEIMAPAAPTGLRFNLSHTEGLIACAVAKERDVGIDAECLLARESGESIAEQFFSPREVAALRALPAAEQHDRFFDLWTLKEAYLKARGVGLGVPLDAFSFELGEKGEIGVSFDAELADSPQAWGFLLLRPCPCHRVAIAARRHAPAEPLRLVMGDTSSLVSGARSGLAQGSGR